MLNRKNALRCVTANLNAALLFTGFVFVYLPESALATHQSGRCHPTDFSGSGTTGEPGSPGRESYHAGPTGTRTGQQSDDGTQFTVRLESCASGRYSTAMGIANGVISSAGGTAVGIANWVGTSGNSSTAVGFKNRVTAATSLAVGRQNTVSGQQSSAVGYNNTASGLGSLAVGWSTTAAHMRSAAFGYNTRTRAADEMAFGTSAGWERLTLSNFEIHTTTYRFAGLAVPESAIAGLPTVERLTDEATLNQRNSMVQTARDTASNRVLGVNGHGQLVALGNVGEFMGSGSGGGTVDADARSRIGVNETAIARNRADIDSLQSTGVNDATRAQINGNTQAAARASQGVALSNALASLPRALLPGEKLRLGIGVGSFDGKSGTAIGVMGKFGASTLLNAGFSTGGGESSTQIGISWGW